MTGWMPTLIIIYFLGRVWCNFNFNFGNVTWFYDRNFDFILKNIMTLIISYLFEKDKLIKLALAAW